MSTNDRGWPPPAPVQPAPVPPAVKTGRGARVGFGVAAAFMLVVLLCILYGAVKIFGGLLGGEQPDDKPVAGASAPADGTPEPTPSIDLGPQVGDCVRNTGTDDDPKLVKAPCAKGAYEIVANIPLTDDPEACKNHFLGAKKPYDATYRVSSTNGLGEYVLCLKSQ